jgi:CubicO group peptidase (beta-lactamase class C family)
MKTHIASLLRSSSIRIISVLVYIVLFLILPAAVVKGQERSTTQNPETIDELKKAILKILKETNTPAAGIALVNKEGPVWIAGLGKADLERNLPATEETMFRIASTSKIFVALSILKLQEQGKLSLKDKVCDLIPEIEFKNQWEQTNPLLVEHLLEHTTGWDEIHLPEKIHSDPQIRPLKFGLDYHPHTRISKWVP